MHSLKVILILVAGLIHLVPVTGILGRKKLQNLYGLEFTDPNLLIMMQHRALLFGLLGVYLIIAAFNVPMQATAIMVGLISAVSFVLMAALEGNYNLKIRRVVMADIVAVICLVVAAFIGG